MFRCGNGFDRFFYEKIIINKIYIFQYVILFFVYIKYLILYLFMYILRIFLVNGKIEKV